MTLRPTYPRNAEGRVAAAPKKSNTKADNANNNAIGARLQPLAGGLDHYRRLFGPSSPRALLDRASLPSPVRYLTECGRLHDRPRGEWASVRCPAHKNGDERN